MSDKEFEDMNKVAEKISELFSSLDLEPSFGEACLLYTAGLSMGVRQPDPTIVDDSISIIRTAYMLRRNQPEAVKKS